MEYYSALKSQDVLSFATTWLKLEDIMLSEISRMQKDSTVRSYSHVEYKVVRVIEAASRMVVARSSGEGEMGRF